jgi:hypothetical protein
MEDEWAKKIKPYRLPRSSPRNCIASESYTLPQAADVLRNWMSKAGFRDAFGMDCLPKSASLTQDELNEAWMDLAEITAEDHGEARRRKESSDREEVLHFGGCPFLRVHRVLPQHREGSVVLLRPAQNEMVGGIESSLRLARKRAGARRIHRSEAGM